MTLPLAGRWQVTREVTGIFTEATFRVLVFTGQPQISSEVAWASTRSGKEIIATLKTEIRKNRIILFCLTKKELHVAYALRHQYIRPVKSRENTHAVKRIYTEPLLLAYEGVEIRFGGEQMPECFHVVSFQRNQIEAKARFKVSLLGKLVS